MYIVAVAGWCFAATAQARSIDGGDQQSFGNNGQMMIDLYPPKTSSGGVLLAVLGIGALLPMLVFSLLGFACCKKKLSMEAQMSSPVNVNKKRPKFMYIPMEKEKAIEEKEKRRSRALFHDTDLDDNIMMIGALPDDSTSGFKRSKSTRSSSEVDVHPSRQTTDGYLDISDHTETVDTQWKIPLVKDTVLTDDSTDWVIPMMEDEPANMSTSTIKQGSPPTSPIPMRSKEKGNGKKPRPLSAAEAFGQLQHFVPSPVPSPRNIVPFEGSTETRVSQNLDLLSSSRKNPLFDDETRDDDGAVSPQPSREEFFGLEQETEFNGFGDESGDDEAEVIAVVSREEEDEEFAGFGEANVDDGNDEDAAARARSESVSGFRTRTESVSGFPDEDESDDEAEVQRRQRSSQFRSRSESIFGFENLDQEESSDRPVPILKASPTKNILIRASFHDDNSDEVPEEIAKEMEDIIDALNNLRDLEPDEAFDYMKRIPLLLQTPAAVRECCDINGAVTLISCIKEYGDIEIQIPAFEAVGLLCMTPYGALEVFHNQAANICVFALESDEVWTYALTALLSAIRSLPDDPNVGPAIVAEGAIAQVADRLAVARGSKFSDLFELAGALSRHVRDVKDFMPVLATCKLLISRTQIDGKKIKMFLKMLSLYMDTREHKAWEVIESVGIPEAVESGAVEDLKGVFAGLKPSESMLI